MINQNPLTLFIAATALCLAVSSTGSVAAQAETGIQLSQLTTDQERKEQRARMRGAKTAEERARIQAEHDKRMKQRARGRGVTPPAASPAPDLRQRAPGRRSRGR